MLGNLVQQVNECLTSTIKNSKCSNTKISCTQNSQKERTKLALDELVVNGYKTSSFCSHESFC